MASTGGASEIERDSRFRPLVVAMR